MPIWIGAKTKYLFILLLTPVFTIELVRSCVGVSASSEEAWNPGSESRTGPLDLRVSPDFRAAVSLGLLTFPRNPLLGKRPNQSVCAEFSRTRWASLWISVGG
jgi:hypothetical protein